MYEIMEANVKLINDKIQFSGICRENPEIIMDYFPPAGDGQGYTGLELLLVSLAGCSATAIVSLLRKMQVNVSGFTVNAKGIRRDVHPMAFKQIFLEFGLISDNATDVDFQKAIQLAEKSICPVWSMLKNNVEIITRQTITNVI